MKGCETGPAVSSSSSERTREFNHLQLAFYRQYFLFQDQGFDQTTSRTVAQCPFDGNMFKDS